MQHYMTTLETSPKKRLTSDLFFHSNKEFIVSIFFYSMYFNLL